VRNRQEDAAHDVRAVMQGTVVLPGDDRYGETKRPRFDGVQTDGQRARVNRLRKNESTK
jgi:hypothetical protein